MTGRLIMVKSQDKYPRLHVVTAVGLTGGFVIIDRPIKLKEDEEPTNIIHRDLCFEYDTNLVEVYNNLQQSAQDKVSAAEQIFELDAVPADVGDEQEQAIH